MRAGDFLRPTVRRPVVGALVVAAGAAVLVATNLLGAIGAPQDASVVTPAPPAQQLVCPGAMLQLGATGSANGVSGTGSAATTLGSVSGAKPKTTGLARGGVDESEQQAAALHVLPTTGTGVADVLAGAQSETAAGSQAAGFAATACTAPSTTSWVAAGATTTGRTSVLLLANPSGVAATVSLSLWTEHGSITGGGLSGIVVPAHAQKTVPLASIAPDAAATVVRVDSIGGTPTATIESSVVRGLETGGADLVGAGAAPATSVVIPGVRIRSAAAVATASQADGYGDLVPVVRLLAPSAATNVTITATPASGTGGAAQTKQLAAGAVVDVPLTGLGDGTYTVTVRASEPVVGAVRVSTIEPDATTSDTGLAEGSTSGDGGATLDTGARGLDLAWFASAQPLGAVAGAAIATGPDPQLVLANPTDATITATLSGAVATKVAVPAGRSIAVAAKTGVIGIAGGTGLVGGVGYAGTAAVAGYPVQPSVLAGQSVAVTR